MATNEGGATGQTNTVAVAQVAMQPVAMQPVTVVQVVQQAPQDTLQTRLQARPCCCCNCPANQGVLTTCIIVLIISLIEIIWISALWWAYVIIYGSGWTLLIIIQTVANIVMAIIGIIAANNYSLSMAKSWFYYLVIQTIFTLIEIIINVSIFDFDTTFIIYVVLFMLLNIWFIQIAKVYVDVLQDFETNPPAAVPTAGTMVVQQAATTTVPGA